MKKRFLGILLSGVMAAGLLAGCGSSSSSSSSSSTTSAATSQAASSETSTAASDAASSEASTAAAASSESSQAASSATGEARTDLLIGVTFPTVANDFAVALRDGTVAALEAKGCKVQFDSADGDVTKQANIVENDITLGCDAIIIWPVNNDGIASTVQRAVDEGIQVLGFANAISTATANNVAASDSDMGKAVAQMASDWIDDVYADAGDGEVQVLCITASNTPQAVERSEGMQTIADNSKVTMTTADVDWDSMDQSRSLVENQLQANPDIDVILTPGNTPGLAANSFVMSSASPIEDKSKFAVFTVDETTEVTDAIKASVNNEAVIRGTVSMGSIDNTINQLMLSMNPFIEGGNIADIHGETSIITPETLGE